MIVSKKALAKYGIHYLILAALLALIMFAIIYRVYTSVTAPAP
jgi:hypothetical protein